MSSSSTTLPLLLLLLLVCVSAASASSIACPSSVTATADVKSVQVYLNPFGQEILSLSVSTHLTDVDGTPASLTLKVELIQDGVSFLRTSHGLEAISTHDSSAFYSVMVTETLPTGMPNGVIQARVVVMNMETQTVVACATFEIEERSHQLYSNLRHSIADSTTPALWSDADIAAHNSNPANHWTAGRNPVFEGKSRADAAKKLGVAQVGPQQLPTHALPESSAVSLATIPTSFSSATQWSDCATIISTIRDQGDCGSCWAFSAVEVLADRACIATTGSDSSPLSPQDLVSCNVANSGCNGGALSTAWNYMVTNGVETETEFPYTKASYNNGVTGKCGSHGTVHPRTYAQTVATYNTVATMQAAIQANGPIQVAFDVYDDFYNYTKGVYHATSTTYEGGHAVKCVGWGVTASGVKYWIMNNQWGTGWGMSGVFWMRRGHNDCGVERGAMAGLYARVQ